MKRSLSIFILLLLLPACDLFEETAEPYEEIDGSYEAVVFTEPGSHDGGVDILASGGKLTLRLEASGNLSGHIVIPPGINSNYAPVDAQYSGQYELLEDTIRFEVREPVGVLPLEEAEWQEDQQEIESFDLPGWGSTFKVVLKRK